MSGSAIQRKIAAGLARAGRRTGSGVLTVEVMRRPATTGPLDSPGQPQSLSVVGMIGNFTPAERTQSNVQVGDLKVLIPGGVVDPVVSDDCRVMGKLYAILDIKHTRPGGEDLMLALHLRGGKPDGT